jgi:hypothetical protein
MHSPEVKIETIHSPLRYTYTQLERAFAIARALDRGALVLAERPER